MRRTDWLLHWAAAFLMLPVILGAYGDDLPADPAARPRDPEAARRPALLPRNFPEEDPEDGDEALDDVPRRISVKLSLAGGGRMHQFQFHESVAASFRGDRAGLHQSICQTIFLSLTGIESIKSFPVKLHRRLQLLIDHEHKICVLTPDQRQHLQRAGEGEVRRFTELAERLSNELAAAYRLEEVKLEFSQSQFEQFDQVKQCEKRMFGPNSFFDKVRERVLTSSQRTIRRAANELGAAGVSCHARPDEPGIYEVRFRRPAVSHRLIELLKEFPQLDVLSFQSTRITDDDLSEVARLDQITALELGETQVGDTGLHHLCSLMNLESLDLSKTGVTDAGLEQITSLKRLQRIKLTGAPVTDAGVARLQAAIPGLEVSR